MIPLPANGHQIISHADHDVANAICEAFHNVNLPRNCSDIQVGNFWSDKYQTYIIWFISPRWWLPSTTMDFIQWANGFAWGWMDARNQI
jgi:hypothetical protein